MTNESKVSFDATVLANTALNSYKTINLPNEDSTDGENPRPIPHDDPALVEKQVEKEIEEKEVEKKEVEEQEIGEEEIEKEEIEEEEIEAGWWLGCNYCRTTCSDWTNGNWYLCVYCIDFDICEGTNSHVRTACETFTDFVSTRFQDVTKTR